MKKLALGVLAMVSFSAQPIKPDTNVIDDVVVGFVAGTLPVFGQAWLMSALKRMKASKGTVVISLASSLAGSYFWFKAGTLFKEECSTGNWIYVVPSMPALMTAIFLEAKG